MIQFIKKSILFSSILFVILLCVCITNLFIHAYSEFPVRKSNIIVLGDSHTEKAINPTYFQSLKNVSQPSEPYILSYWKLQELTKRTQIDTLILGFAPHNIASFNDEKFKDSKWAPEMFRRSYMIFNLSDLSKINYHIPTFFSTLLHEMCLYPKKDHFTYIGGYKNDTTNLPHDAETAINRHYFYKSKTPEISQVSIESIEAIIEHCSHKNIILYLVNCPLHTSYSEKIPPLIKNQYEILKTKYTLKGVEVIDMGNYPVAETNFLNSDHLNKKGAEGFSIALKNKISKSHKTGL